MIRKDVKAGFAIGGVLLAVLVVYLIVGTDASKKNSGATIDDGASAMADNGGAEKGTDKDLAVVEKDKKVPISDSSAKPASIEIAGAGKMPTAPIMSATPDSASKEIAKDNSGSTAVANNSKPSDANADLWDSSLNRGEMMMSETPTTVKKDVAADRSVKKSPTASPTLTTPREAVAGTDNATPADHPVSMSAAPPAEPALVPIPRGDASDSSAAPSAAGTADAPAVVDPNAKPAVAARTHTIQKGETLAKISEVAYGSPNYYPHILRANPGLNANKMRPGTTINLPPMSEVIPAKTAERIAAKKADAASDDAKPDNTALAAAATVKLPDADGKKAPSIAKEIPFDPKSQYRVESGDSLYRISVKLYGNGSEVDKIYDVNKATIGGDKAKLKLNMLLNLPEAPTETVSR